MENWRSVVRVGPRAERGRFVASVAHYLNLCHYGDGWRPLALYRDGEVVGLAVWGYEDPEDRHRIGGLIISAGRQGKGYGRAAETTTTDQGGPRCGYW